MESAYYKENLYDINHLKEELDEIYHLSTQLEKYTKTIHRGSEQLEFMKEHDSYIKAKSFVDITTQLYTENPKSHLSQICLNGGELEWNTYPIIHNWIINKSFELFKEHCGNINSLFLSKPLLTLYTKGCTLDGHRDGKPDGYMEFTQHKAANILIYLNKEYKKEYGGLFIVDDEVIVPNFADILFLNFSGESNPFHMVSKVKEDVNRLALLLNVQYHK